MDRFIKSMKAFPFKGMLVIWGIFMLMGVVLFAERSGIHYEGSKSQSAYLSENQIVTEKEAVKELKKDLPGHYGQPAGEQPACVGTI